MYTCTRTNVDSKGVARKDIPLSADELSSNSLPFANTCNNPPVSWLSSASAWLYARSCFLYHLFSYLCGVYLLQKASCLLQIVNVKVSLRIDNLRPLGIRRSRSALASTQLFPVWALTGTVGLRT